MGSSTASHQRTSITARREPGGAGGSAIRPPMVSAGLEASRPSGAGTGKVTGNTPDVLLRSALEEHGGALRPLPGPETLHLLVIDEDENVRRAICEIASVMGFVVHPSRNETDAEELLKRRSVDVVLMDLRPQDQGFTFLQELHQRLPRVPIIVMTAFATVTSVVDAMRIGASDCLTKPFALDELTGTLEVAAQRRQFDGESRRLQESIVRDAGQRGVIGSSAAMEKLLRMVAKVAPAAHPVLIMGESGSGKEMIARLIHGSSAVADRTMRAVDCSALPPAMLEAELFGFVRYEGTAQREEHQGLLTQTDGATLFVREIGNMPLELQAKLQRALQERRVRPAGSAMSLPVTARLLASSSRDLPQLVESNQFRRDLYFRLNVVQLRVPPLRERRDDIPLLATYFLQRQAHARHKEYELDTEVLGVLDGYDWPGNVRELEGSIERACSFSSGPQIFLKDFPSQLMGYRQQLHVETLRVDARVEPRESRVGTGLSQAATGVGATGIVSIAELEKQAILAAIHSLNGDKLMAAKLLGIGKTTLYRKLKEYGLDDE